MECTRCSGTVFGLLYMRCLVYYICVVWFIIYALFGLLYMRLLYNGGITNKNTRYVACNHALLYSFVNCYSHNKSYNDLLLFVYLKMLLQRFYSLILPNPGVQIAYNKCMSIYGG
jgi:hypothetical protein